MLNPPRIDAPIPKGVADFLPDTADKIGYIQEQIRRVFELWGFRRIITPLLEFEDVLALGIGDELRSRTFRFDDRQSGRLLAIPSDITPQVARIVATRMCQQPFPYRICYHGRVLRHAEIQSGRSREIFQAGVELIGLDSPEADAEMVAMAVEVLQGLGIRDFKMDIGQVEFFRGIMAAAGLDGATARQLKIAIGKKDASAVRELLESIPAPDRVKEAIASLPRLFGGRKVLDEAAGVAVHDRCKRALENIEQVLQVLDVYGVTEYLTIDLGEIRGLDYHTGLTFEGFVSGLGEPVCSGGRYDDLTARYGFPAPATGFAFNILALLAALERQPDVEASTARDFLLFNAADDRREALRIAKCLRTMGYSVARDIIRREYDDSLEYARRMNIRRMLIIGGSYCTDDEVSIVRVADGSTMRLKKNLLFQVGGRLDLDALWERQAG
ncbi:MAG: ATP phosphoribosyltransferase regulatory subunit [Geobacter sp.]|nr:ATP phosphoribosyltransferase regulatory subunit [Geobacter sp.]